MVITNMNTTKAAADEIIVAKWEEIAVMHGLYLKSLNISISDGTNLY